MKDVNILTNNGINVAASLELFGDMPTYEETITDFLEGINQKLADIKMYKENSDMANYAILVHSLKSDSKYLGFTTLAELAYQHEMQSKANDISFVYNNYDALMNEAKRIVNVLKTYMGIAIEQETSQEESVQKKVIDKSILVVDDSDVIRTFIQKIFNDEYKVVVAHDGKEAIDIISISDTSKILGVLLDLNMPNVNGFEVLEFFKANNLFVKIPVSIITGDDSREVVAKAYNYPITDVLGKPFNERDIKIVLDKMIVTYQ